MIQTLREMTRLVTNPRVWVVFSAVVILCALTGPFGTYIRLDFIPRLGYWLIVQSTTWAIALFCISAAVALLEPRKVSIMMSVIVGAAFAALPISVFVMTINTAVFDLPASLTELARNTLVSAPIAVAFGLIVFFTMQRDEQKSSDTKSGVPLLKRLPIEKRGNLVRMSVSDHYTEVVTDKGSHLVLLRFSDALDELGIQDGMQVHRSHWVASSAVKKLQRKDGRLNILIQDGTEIPVSRTYASAVRGAFAGESS